MDSRKEKGYIVPHTHWDREWRYPIWQSRMMLVRFMDELLDILDTDDKYASFVLDSQCVALEDYFEVRPDKKEKVCKYIKEGRISVGPWYTLPDLYPVDGECLVRNLLKGIRYSKSLGGYLKVGYNTFGWGQTAQFPQIYKEFGFDVVITAKNVSKSRAPESEFIWEAPDGTKVLATRLGEHARANFFMNAYIPILYGKYYLSDEYRFEWGKTGLSYHQADEAGFYNDHICIEDKGYIHHDIVKEAVSKAWEGTNDTTVKSLRLLMNGSDFSTPQPKLTEIIEKANEVFNDKEFIHTKLEDYTDELKKLVDYSKLKVVKGELRDGPASACSSNALATRYYIKSLNRKVQNSLILTAEPLSVMGLLAGIVYQKEFIDIAIEYMLKSQAHDSINGVTQDKTADDTVYRLKQALEISDVVINNVCSELLKQINSSTFNENDILLIVVNPLPMEREEIIKVYIDIPKEMNVWECEIEDCEGNKVPVQFVSRQEKVVPVHDFNSRPWPFYIDRHCLYMDTGTLPPCGYKVFKVIPKSTFSRNIVFWPEMRKSEGNDILKHPNILENEYLKVKVRENGTVDILEKESGRLFSQLNYYEDTGDCGDYWVYYPPYHNKTYNSLGCKSEIWVEDNGLLSATIGTKIKMNVPSHAYVPENGIRGESRRSIEMTELQIITRYTLVRGSRRLDVKVEVNNTAEDHKLRVLFDTGIKSEFTDAAGHFTVDRRANVPEKDENGRYYPEMKTYPMQQFVDISDGKNGFGIISNCLSEYEVVDDDGTLSFTLFRSVRNIICSEFRSAGVFPHEKGGQSLGIQKYEYSIYPHSGNWRDGAVYKEARRFNIPTRAIQTSRNTNGNLPLKYCFFSVEPDNLIMSSLKRAEDRDSIIVRLYNPADEEVEGCVHINVPIKEAYLTNLNEERLNKLDLNNNNSLKIKAGGNKIITLEVVV